MSNAIVPAAQGQRVRTRAHTEAIQIGVHDLLGELSRVFGRQLLAIIVGKDVRTIQRWIAAGKGPGADDESRLRNAYQIYALLSRVEGDHTVRAWFMGMNPQLEDESPAEALADDRAREVMAAARAFVNGD